MIKPKQKQRIKLLNVFSFYQTLFMYAESFRIALAKWDSYVEIVLILIVNQYFLQEWKMWQIFCFWVYI